MFKTILINRRERHPFCDHCGRDLEHSSLYALSHTGMKTLHSCHKRECEKAVTEMDRKRHAKKKKR